ncbi:hypothetical protein JCM10449v2_000725 [Rhodotorula kratochvilovae]
MAKPPADHPAVANFTPPTGCGTPGTWASIVLNLTVTSNGTQFDRLASISLGHVEIWRTSTAEPTRSGIVWSYEKDVTRFSPLFAKEGQLMFQLDNVITDKYTGVFSTQLTATFYVETPDFPAPAAADLIVPLTTGSKNSSQMLVYPGQDSVTPTLPINTAEAWLEIIATGAADEEFWYTNVLDRWSEYFPDAGLIGKGPLREVQVRIDGQLGALAFPLFHLCELTLNVTAGFVYPFPVIYTGGANPLLWRPLASLRAFDVPSAFIDVSPFLPMLSDSLPHEFAFSVLGQGKDGSVNDNWFITGALHLVLDPSNPPVRTTGRMLSYDVAPLPLIISAGFPSPDGKTLRTLLSVQRTLDIRAELETGAGRKEVRVSHEVRFENDQFYDDYGTYERVSQSTSSLYTSQHNNRTLLRDVSSFPLSLTTNYTLFDSAHRFSASLPAYAYNRALSLPPALGGVEGAARVTKSTQEGEAEITGREGARSTGWGRLEERYSFMGERGETYEEVVKAVVASEMASLPLATASAAAAPLAQEASSSTLADNTPTTSTKQHSPSTSLGSLDLPPTSTPSAAAPIASPEQNPHNSITTATSDVDNTTAPDLAFASAPATSLDMHKQPGAALDPPAEDTPMAVDEPAADADGEVRVDSLVASEGGPVDATVGDGPLNPGEVTGQTTMAGEGSAADNVTAGAKASGSGTPLDAATPVKQAPLAPTAEGSAGTAAAPATTGLDSPFASPKMREATPSETASEAASAAGPAVAPMNVPPPPSSATAELAHPLSAYPFANTSLVPAASTSTKPFFFTNFPPIELTVSWARSKRGDDPEADIPLDREAGYFVAGKDLTESRKREAARMAKVRNRLAEMGLAPDGSVIPVVAPVEPTAGKRKGKGRAAPTARGGSRSREASKGVDGAAPTGRRGGRQSKASALREVQPDEVDELEEIDVDAPRPSRVKAKKAVAAPPRSPTPPPPAPPPPPPPPAVFRADLASTLLQDDLQTSTPMFLEPHPAFIDHLDLPPHYLPAGVDLDSLPAVTKPNPIIAARLAAAAAPPAAPADAAAAPSPALGAQADGGDAFMRDEYEADEDMKPVNGDGTSVADGAAGAGASPDASSAAATPKLSTEATPAFAADAAAPVEATSSGRPSRASTAGKRARQTEDDGPKPTKRKKARESTVGSEASEEIPLGPPVEYVVQQTTCLSKKVDGQVRCWQCIARSIGHGCSFMGIRSFGVDYLGRIVTPPVFRSSTEPDEVPNLDKPYTSPMTKTQSTLLKTWLAREVIKICDREWKHATDHNTIKVRNDLVTHSTCDTCNTVCMGAEWICKTCGRTACPLCFERLKQFEATEAAGGSVPTTADNQRRRKCVAKKRGKEHSGGESHRPAQFVPVTRLDASKLERMRQVARNWHGAHKLQASDPKVVQYIMEKFCIKSNLREYDADTHRVWTIAHRTFDEPFFFEVWRRGEPILVRRCPPRDLAKFTPDFIAEKWGDHKIDVINNRDPDIVEQWTVKDFFGALQTREKRRSDAADKDKRTFRMDDWARPAQWFKEYKSLQEAFLSFLPLPNVFHPDGVLNCIGHTPDNAAQPQRGPRLMSSWDTDAATPTIKLQTSNTDIASYMFWGGRDPVTGKALRIRWDVFREEDIPKLRDFCYDLLHSQQPKGTSNTKFRELHDDPLLSPTMYLTKKQRAALYKRSGVKPYPIYQYMGDLVLVPAGCPYQVSSWIDHMNLSISFLAGSRVTAAMKTSVACQNATRERTLWYRDNIQLETQLFYTWMSCDAFDRAGKVGTKTVRGKLNWPFPKDDTNRPIIPPDEEKRLADLAAIEKRGSEISARLKAESSQKAKEVKGKAQSSKAESSKTVSFETLMRAKATAASAAVAAAPAPAQLLPAAGTAGEAAPRQGERTMITHRRSDYSAMRAAQDAAAAEAASSQLAAVQPLPEASAAGQGASMASVLPAAPPAHASASAEGAPAAGPSGAP